MATHSGGIVGSSSPALALPAPGEKGIRLGLGEPGLPPGLCCFLMSDCWEGLLTLSLCTTALEVD